MTISSQSSHSIEIDPKLVKTKTQPNSNSQPQVSQSMEIDLTELDFAQTI
ncbi:7141_t:CDS:1, partial [Dentiscutata erythropus]